MPTVPDQVRATASRWPDAVAWQVAGGPALTLGEWDADSNRLARSLREAGVGRGDPVALVFDDDDILTFVRAYVGVQKAGGYAVILNPFLSASELALLVGHAEPVAVLGSARIVREFQETTDALDGRRAIVAVGQDVHGAARWQDFLSDDDSDVDAGITEDDPADVLYTSGTTGRPKGLIGRHRDVSHLPLQPPDEWNGGHFLHAQPVASQVTESMIVTGTALGVTVLFLRPFTAERWLDAVRRYRPLASYLAPVMVHEILQLDAIDAEDLESLRLVSVGNSPIDHETLERFDALLPNARPQNTYSLTEFGPGYTMLPPDEFDRRRGSVGRPVPPLELRIIDPDSGEELPPGEVGEIVARVGDRHRRYHRDPDREAAAWRGGWLHTGDLGHLDDDGFLYVAGRMDDVVIRGGFNVPPEEPEQVIRQHEDVQDVAAVGVPHPTLGEDLVAFVVPRAGAGTSADELLAWCEERLGEPLRPSAIHLVDELPRNSEGKVVRRRLVERVAS